jgi:hypothetical protein
MGALKSPRCSKRHRMIGDNVGWGMKANGKTYRYCVKCSRNRVKKFRAKKKELSR